LRRIRKRCSSYTMHWMGQITKMQNNWKW
jgi:hypothetical protein